MCGGWEFVVVILFFIFASRGDFLCCDFFQEIFYHLIKYFSSQDELQNVLMGNKKKKKLFGIFVVVPPDNYNPREYIATMKIFSPLLLLWNCWLLLLPPPSPFCFWPYPVFSFVPRFCFVSFLFLQWKRVFFFHGLEKNPRGKLLLYNWGKNYS